MKCLHCSGWFANTQTTKMYQQNLVKKNKTKPKLKNASLF